MIRKRRNNKIDAEFISMVFDPKNISLMEARRLFLQDCKIKNLSPRTIKWYNDSLRTFFRHLAELDITLLHDVKIVFSLHSIERNEKKLSETQNRLILFLQRGNYINDKPHLYNIN